MEETHKIFDLRITKDGKTALLDCDISTDGIEELVATISNELKALGIKDLPDQKQLSEQLHRAAEVNPYQS